VQLFVGTLKAFIQFVCILRALQQRGFMPRSLAAVISHMSAVCSSVFRTQNAELTNHRKSSAAIAFRSYKPAALTPSNTGKTRGLLPRRARAKISALSR
jgi:hypothetical protein